MASDNTAAWIAGEWAKAFASSFGAMAGAPLQVLLNESPSPYPASPGLFCWQQLFSAGAESLLWVEAPPESWKPLGEWVLRAVGIEGLDDPSKRSTYHEVLQQSLAGLAQRFGQQLKREVTCLAGAEIPSAPSEETTSFLVELTSREYGVCSLSITISAGLISVLESVTRPRADSRPSSLPALPSHEPVSPAPPSTMGLLMEVELPISVSFGRTQMRLKDVIKLTTGSIVELNRTITEPVEIIVNNCVIARGTVVVVEGNYGVHIQQIVSREERLRTLY